MAILKYIFGTCWGKVIDGDYKGILQYGKLESIPGVTSYENVGEAITTDTIVVVPFFGKAKKIKKENILMYRILETFIDGSIVVNILLDSKNEASGEHEFISVHFHNVVSASIFKNFATGVLNYDDYHKNDEADE